jgi:hypothetical protein
MFDDNYGYGDYVEDAQVYDPSIGNPYEDPWTSASYGTVDFLGPAEQSQFEGFDSTLTGDENVTFFDSNSSWDDATF